MRVVALLGVLCVALLLSSPLTNARAADPQPYLGPAWQQRMTFAVFRRSYVGINQSFTRLGEVAAVYATGRIYPGSADELRAFLDRNAVEPGVTVFLHSPGGDANEGLVMGRLIRRRLLLTNIGQVARQQLLTGSFQEFGPNEPGECASACSLAFLGGIQRSAMNGSVYAVHDAALVQAVPNPFAFGQKLAAEEAVFYAEMGVDAKLLDIKNSYDSSANQLAWLSPELMATLRVTTPPLITSWRSDTDVAGFYVVGESRNQFGHQNTVYFRCIQSIPDMTFRFQLTGKTILGLPIDPRTFANDATSLQIADTSSHASALAAQRATAVINLDKGKGFAATYNERSNEIFLSVDIKPPISEFLRTANVITFTFGLPPPPNGAMQISPAQQASYDLSEGRRMILSLIDNCK